MWHTGSLFHFRSHDRNYYFCFNTMRQNVVMLRWGWVILWPQILLLPYAHFILSNSLSYIFIFSISLNSLWFFSVPLSLWLSDSLECKTKWHYIASEISYTSTTELIITLCTFYVKCFYKLLFDSFYFSSLALVLFCPAIFIAGWSSYRGWYCAMILLGDVVLSLVVVFILQVYLVKYLMIQ